MYEYNTVLKCINNKVIEDECNYDFSKTGTNGSGVKSADLQVVKMRKEEEEKERTYGNET